MLKTIVNVNQTLINNRLRNHYEKKIDMRLYTGT